MKKEKLKKGGIASAAILAGMLSISASKGPEDPRGGIMVAKSDTYARVRDYETNEVITVEYGNPDSHEILIGDYIEYYNADANTSILIDKITAERYAAFFHS